MYQTLTLEENNDQKLQISSAQKFILFTDDFISLVKLADLIQHHTHRKSSQHP
jgi:hypothetical protein